MGKITLARAFVCSTALCALSPAVAFSLPQGGLVAGGVADISTPAAAQMQITQGSDRAVIDWASFNIGAGERVDIRQPSTSAVLLNRIGDANPSQIHGQLSANGNVILANPNGMVFGPTAQVDVGGLVATTSRFPDTQGFLNGGALPGQPGSPRASITQQGIITARRGGLAALVAPGVQNDGLIVAKAGKVQISGSDTVTYDMHGDGLIAFASPAQKAAYVGNTGHVEASQVVISAQQAAHIVDSAVNLGGSIAASKLVTAPDGSLMLGGGEVDITADHIALSGKVDASGHTGGGRVHVGGGWQGSGPLPWAKTVSMAPDARIDVSAKQTGKGGEAVLWSNDGTTVAGTIHAKGGAQGGDGGRIETSGLALLDIAESAKADASATNGKPGLWLLDPNNITIHATSADANIAGSPNYTSTANSGRILDDNIRTALNGGTSVTITTGTAGLNSQNGDINTSGAVDVSTTSATDVTLTMKAHRNITLGAGTGGETFTATASGAGRLNLVLWSNFDGDASAGRVSLTNSTVTTNGGFVHIAGGLDDGSNGGVAADGRPDGYSVGLSGAQNGVAISGTDITTGAGSITIRGQALDAIANSQHGIILQSGSSLLTTSGNVTLQGIGGKGVSGNTGIRLLGNACAGGCTEIVTTSGAINLHGTGGADQDTDGAGPDVRDGLNTNPGIRMDNFARITTQGTGTINLTGIGAVGTDTNYGIHLETGAFISSTAAGATAGSITMHGTAGQGAGTNNRGIMLEGNNCVGGVNCTSISTNGGNISLTGIGGADQDTDGAGPDIKESTTANDGITLSAFSRITSSGVGSISLNGTGANGTTSNMGIRLTAGSAVKSTGTGSITMLGRGGDAVSNNHGIYLAGNNCTGGADCTEITSVTGNINLTGTGGADQDTDGAGPDIKEGLSTNIGIFLADAAQIITSGSANILLTGTGADAVTLNYGVYLTEGSSIESTATGASAGTITVNGTGGNGSTGNHGVFIQGNDCVGGVNCTEIVSSDGDILLNGIGSGSDFNNIGLPVTRGARIRSLGTTSTAADITLNGTGANGATGGSRGATLATGSLVESTAGNITFTGNAGTGGTGEFGSALSGGASIRSLGTAPSAGNITINGTGTGERSGVRFDNGNGNSIISAVDGNILLQGTAGTTGYSAVDLLSSAPIVSQTGTMTLRGAKMSIMNGTSTIGGSTSSGAVLIDGALEGLSGTTSDVAAVAGNLAVQTTGGVTFAGAVGGSTPLGQVTITGASSVSATAGSFNTQNFTLTGGTGPVAFTGGTGLNATNYVTINTNGNITGSYTGGSGHLYAGAGSINATVNFSSLDISGTSATLTGSVGGSNGQDGADRIMVNGSRGPATAAYQLGTARIGVNVPPTGGGTLPPVINTPRPPVNPGGNDLTPPTTNVPDLPVIPPSRPLPVSLRDAPARLQPTVARGSNIIADTASFNQPRVRQVGERGAEHVLFTSSNSLDAQYYAMTHDEGNMFIPQKDDSLWQYQNMPGHQ